MVTEPRQRGSGRSVVRPKENPMTIDRPKIRVGAVSYLNTKPLIWRLAEIAPWIELSLDLPSRLADELARGRLDVALIPSIEFSPEAGQQIVSDACIACRGPVMSVKLFSRRPVAEVRTLALDEGSRTSIALVRVLLNERFALEPQLEALPLGASVSDSPADAVLVIGDRAMHSPGGGFADVWDLGDEWVRWSGLPFVFAMWVARPGIDLTGLAEVLGQARNDGLAIAETIAEKEAARLGLSRPQCLTYLRDHLHFYLGSRERRGLELFRELAGKLDGVPSAAC